VLNRTYEGYQTEISTIYGQLESILGVKIEPAPDEWDRTYNVDFFIQIRDRFIGLQVKSVSGRALDYYQWERMHEVNHEKFRERFGGVVFFIYSLKVKGKAKINNVEVIQEIQNEIEKLQREE
jgi:hypothetical protein